MKARFRGGRALRGWPAGRAMGCWLAVIWAMGAFWSAPAAAQDLDWEGLSPRFAIGTSAGLMAAGEVQTSPSIACDTTLSHESWVIWQDERLGDPDIFAARVTAEGELRDPSGLPIAVGPDRQTAPRIAAGGGVFLAIWQATDATKSAYRIEGVRLGSDGAALDESPVLITESDYELADLDLAFGTSSFMVTWTDTLGGRFATHGARIAAADGQVLDEEYIVLNAESNQQTGGDIAFNGEQYLLVYSREATLYDTTLGSQGQITSIDTTSLGEIAGRYISEDGAPAEETIKIEAAVVDADYTTDDLPMLAFGGDRFLVTWPARDVGQSQTSNREIFGRTLMTDGTLSARFGIAQTLRPRDSRTITGGPGGYQLAWVLQRGATTTYYGVHVNSDGSQVSTEYEIVPLVSSLGLEEPGGCGLVWNGEEYVFVGAVKYIAVAGDDQDIRMSWLDAAGVVTGGPVIVSQATSMQIPRAVVFDGSRYLTVWDEQVIGGWQIHGAFVTTEGVPAGPSFAVLPETHPQPWAPALAFGAGSFVLTWTEGTSLYAARLDADGQQTGARLRIADIATGRAAVGWDGERFPVAWKYVSGSDQGLMLSRVEYSGAELALVPFRLVTAPGSSVETTSIRLLYGTSSDPGLTCSGEQNLILWASKGFGIYAVQLPDTTTTWSNANLAVRLATGSDPGVPRAIFDGANYFIGWTDLPGTYAVRVRPDGLVLDPGRIPLDLQSQASDRPAVATDGSNRLAIWRSGSEGRWTLKGGRYGTDGRSIAGVEVFAGLDRATRWPLATKGPDGQVLLIYASYLSDAEHGALRLHGKLWQQQPPQVDIALHQNPGVTSDVSIIATPSEDISQGTLDVRANGAPIEMELVDAAHGIYQGWYQARATTVVRVVAAVGDSAGNLTLDERSFGIGEVSPGDGGFLTGPDGFVTLSCPPRALAIRSYVMILPQAAGSEATAANGFLLSPPDLEFEIPAALAARVPPRPSGLALSAPLPILERQVGQVWEPVPAQWSASDGTLRATITRLGMFRTRWAEAGEVSEPRIALSLGPAPWRTDLTLRYRLPRSGEVQLVVFDAAGRRVATLVDGVQEGGSEHTVVWNGALEGGGRAASGVYFARLRSADQMVTRRSIRVR